VSFTLELLATPTFSEIPLDGFQGFTFGGVVYVKRQ
jgi:hypothetical protein